MQILDSAFAYLIVSFIFIIPSLSVTLVPVPQALLVHPVL